MPGSSSATSGSLAEVVANRPNWRAAKAPFDARRLYPRPLASADMNASAPPPDSYGEPAVARPATGRFLYTFTARLPFILGIEHGHDHELELSRDFVSLEDTTVFGRRPFVRIRMFNAALADRKFYPANMEFAVEHFYRCEFSTGEAAGPHLYEQWVTLETPAVFLAGERRTDPVYAFHRSLSTLNLFLQAFALARGDDRVRQVSARELRPIVVIGRLDLHGHWELETLMAMHPDAKKRPLGSQPIADHLDGLNRAVTSILVGEPFIRTDQWRARASRRRYEGDAADAVISFQTAAETLLYELWALILTDEGLTDSQVQSRRDAGMPFKSLLSSELPRRIGGSWDLTLDTAPVGRYWHRLYLVRNRIVHAGYLPHDGDAEVAEAAFVELDHFLDHQIRSRKQRFPVTARAKLERNFLSARPSP